MKKFTLPLIAMVALSSCGRQSYIPLGGHTAKMHHVSNRTERQVVVYTKIEEVPANLKQIGIMSSSNFNSTKTMVKAKNFTARAGGTSCLLIDRNEMLTRTDKKSNTYVNPELAKRRWNFIMFE